MGDPLDDSALGETSDHGGTLRFTSAIASMGADLSLDAGSLDFGDDVELTTRTSRGDEVEYA